MHAVRQRGARGLWRPWPRCVDCPVPCPRSDPAARSSPRSTGTCSTTAASSATCARGCASCTKASAACASCARPRGGQIVLTTYGRSSGFCVDPIEKKPLDPLPSRHRRAVVRHRRLQPRLQVLPELGHEEVARDGHARRRRRHPRRSRGWPRQLGCRSVAFTYNDPVIFHEYAIDVAEACREPSASRRVAVTAGYVCAEPREEFYRHMDAANVDLKGFTERLLPRAVRRPPQPVLETLELPQARHEHVVRDHDAPDPGRERLGRRARRADDVGRRTKLGPDVPLHFSAFHPDFRMLHTAGRRPRR